MQVLSQENQSEGQRSQSLTWKQVKFITLEFMYTAVFILFHHHLLSQLHRTISRGQSRESQDQGTSVLASGT